MLVLKVPTVLVPWPSGAGTQYSGTESTHSAGTQYSGTESTHSAGTLTMVVL